MAQAANLNLPIVRVEAIEADSLSNEDSFVAKGVVATWKSHQLAMSTFLDSGEDYGIILEDDFCLTRAWNSKVLEESINLNPDFFQYGYLVTSPLDRIELILNDSFDCFLKLLCKLSSSSRMFEKRLGTRLLIREQKSIPWNVVPNDIRAGGHAYLISQKFAHASKFMNSPSFTSADGMFMSLGDVRTFRMFRFRRSIVNQTDSPSSVKQRYL